MVWQRTTQWRYLRRRHGSLCRVSQCSAADQAYRDGDDMYKLWRRQQRTRNRSRLHGRTPTSVQEVLSYHHCHCNRARYTSGPCNARILRLLCSQSCPERSQIAADTGECNTSAATQFPRPRRCPGIRRCFLWKWMRQRGVVRRCRDERAVVFEKHV